MINDVFNEQDKQYITKNNLDIYQLAQIGEVAKVKRLLMSYPINLNQRNVLGNGRTLLHEASANGHLSLVKFLLDFKDININKETYLGKDTALHLGVWSGHRNIVSTLLALGADPNKKNKYGATPMHYVGSQTSICAKIIASYLCNNGALTTLKDLNHLTPIESVLANGYNQKDELVVYLLNENKIITKKSLKTELESNRADKIEKIMEETERKLQEKKKEVQMLNGNLMNDYMSWRS